MNYGYARVSTTTQNLDRQLVEFRKLGIEEKIYSKIKNRERLQ